VDLIRDPLWGFVPVVVALLLFPATLWLQRVRKVLAFEIVSNSPLLRVRDEVKEKIQVLYEGQPVGNVGLIIVKVLNEGNQQVLAQDFVEPIAFRLGPTFDSW
jgi:hypothetical protein